MKNISATDSLSNKSSSSAEDLPSKAAGIAWCSAFALEAVLIVAGNLLTIILFATNKKLRTKKSLYLVINMAFADLMLGVVNVPQYILILGNNYQLWLPSWIDSLDFVLFIEIIIWQASLVSATMIAVERVFAFYWPFKHLTISLRAYCITTCVPWVLSIVFCTAFSVLSLTVSNKFALFLVVSWNVTLLLIVCICNFGVWKKFQQGDIASHQQNRTAQNKRLTKTLLFMSLIALLSCLPLLILQFLEDLIKVPRVLVNIIFLLSFTNSFLNAVVYAWRIPEFKQALRSSCFGRQAVINTMESVQNGSESGASVLPMTQFTTLATDPSHLNIANEEARTETNI